MVIDTIWDLETPSACDKELQPTIRGSGQKILCPPAEEAHLSGQVATGTTMTINGDRYQQFEAEARRSSVRQQRRPNSQAKWQLEQL